MKIEYERTTRTTHSINLAKPRAGAPVCPKCGELSCLANSLEPEESSWFVCLCCGYEVALPQVGARINQEALDAARAAFGYKGPILD